MYHNTIQQSDGGEWAKCILLNVKYDLGNLGNLDIEHRRELDHFVFFLSHFLSYSPERISSLGHKYHRNAMQILLAGFELRDDFGSVPVN